MALLEFYYERLYQEDYSTQVEQIKQICYDLISEYQQEKTSSSSSICEPLTQEANAHSDNLVAFDLFVQLKKRARSSSTRT